MNVYIVIEHNYHDNGGIMGIYTTEDKANQRLAQMRQLATKRGWTLAFYKVAKVEVDYHLDITV